MYNSLQNGSFGNSSELRKGGRAIIAKHLDQKQTVDGFLSAVLERQAKGESLIHEV